MPISRRDFLKTSVAMVPAVAVMPAVFRRAVAASLLESPSAAGGERTLIVVQMAGGNDPLNTLVPYADGRYYDLRPNLAIPEGDVLPLNNEVGFHPSLAKLKTFWDQGMLAIVEGVGYPSPSFSHFSSMDIWQSADPEAKLKDGWLGRYFDTLDSTQGVIQGLAASGRRRDREGETETPRMAVTINPTELAAAVDGGVDATTATRLLAVARALVDRYAFEAPEPIANEAAIRVVGYLLDQPAAALRTQTVGPLTVEIETARQSALRHSGAMAMLSPWKIRRAGAIG